MQGALAVFFASPATGKREPLSFFASFENQLHMNRLFLRPSRRKRLFSKIPGKIKLNSFRKARKSPKESRSLCTLTESLGKDGGENWPFPFSFLKQKRMSSF